MKKLTKKDYFNQLLTLKEVEGNEQLKNFILHELDLLARKSEGKHKLTEVQLANIEIGKKIIDILNTENRIMTVTEIQKASEELSIYSNQKLSAIIRNLVQNGTLERIEDKRKAYFQVL